MILKQNSTAANVLAVVCSWALPAKEVAAELQISASMVYAALKRLRAAGYVAPHDHPTGWNQIIKPTPAGRAALAESAKRWAE